MLVSIYIKRRTSTEKGIFMTATFEFLSTLFRIGFLAVGALLGLVVTVIVTPVCILVLPIFIASRTR